MMTSTLLKLSIVSLLLPSASASAVITFPNGVSCGGSIDASDITLACDGDCTWGKRVSATGSVVAKSALPDSSAGVTLKLLGVPLYDTQVDLCARVAASDGSTCPGAGTYNINDLGFLLPGDESSMFANLYGTTVPLKAIFSFEGSSTTFTCSANVHLAKSGSSAVAGAVIVLVGLAAALGIRRRRVATIKLAEEEGSNSHFEMMPNGDTVQV